MKKLFILTALLALGGCTSGREAAFDCPVTGFMDKADSAAFFATPAKEPGPEDVGVYAALKNLRGECRLTRKGGAEVDVNFDVVAQKTARGQGIARQNLSYFIAVLDADESILQRAQFYTAVDFGADGKGKGKTAPGSGLTTQEHTVKIPLAAPAEAAKKRVVIGFTLAPEQLEFNNRHPYDALRN
jgi:hypothetical protein